jgi:hypothetical protein
VRIDRLTLHTGPLTGAEARELARLIAEDLAALPLPPAGSVRVSVAQPATGGVASLREAVARAVEAAVTRGRAPDATASGGRS